jgi:hypothetical protein
MKEELTTATLRSEKIVCVRLPDSKHLHYARVSAFKTTADKSTAKSLCNQTGPWRFDKAGHPCQTCHIEASRLKMAVVSAPKLDDPPRPRDSSTWRGGSMFFESSRYGGICRACGLPYQVGSRVYWKPNEGARHEECGEHPAQEATP